MVFANGRFSGTDLENQRRFLVVRRRCSKHQMVNSGAEITYPFSRRLWKSRE